MNRWNTKRWFLVGITGLAVALVAYFLLKPSKPEPLYRGQTVKYWISQLGSSNPSKRSDPFDAFFRPKTNAIPFLIRTLETRQPLLRRVIHRVRPELPRAWQGKLRFPDGNIAEANRIAISAIALIGDEARDAVPALVRVLFDKDTGLQDDALAALSQMSPDALQAGAHSAIPILCKMLKEESDPEKGAVVETLARFGSDAEAAVPDLVEIVRTNQIWVTRMFSLNALAHVAPQSVAFSNAVVFALSDENDQVRLQAMKDGLEMQVQLQIILPALLRTMRSNEASYRWQAMEILEKAGPLKSFAVFDLIAQLNDENNRVRGLAAIMLGRLGPASKPAVPALKAALKDEYVNVREAAAEALKKIAAETVSGSDTGP